MFKILVSIFSPPPLTYLRFDSKRLFFSLLRKIFGVHLFSLPSPLNLLGIKIQKKTITSQLWQFWSIKIAFLFKNWCPFFLLFLNLLEIWFPKIFFFTSEKNIWCPFFISPPPLTYLQLVLKFKKKNNYLTIFTDTEHSEPDEKKRGLLKD